MPSQVQSLVWELTEHQGVTKENENEIRGLLGKLLSAIDNNPLPVDARQYFEWERDDLLDNLGFKCCMCKQVGIPVKLIAFECDCNPDICLDCARRILQLNEPYPDYEIRCPIETWHSLNRDFSMHRCASNGYIVLEDKIYDLDDKIGRWKTRFYDEAEVSYDDIVKCQKCDQRLPNIHQLWIHKRYGYCPRVTEYCCRCDNIHIRGKHLVDIDSDDSASATSIVIDTDSDDSASATNIVINTRLIMSIKSRANYDLPSQNRRERRRRQRRRRRRRQRNRYRQQIKKRRRCLRRI